MDETTTDNSQESFKDTIPPTKETVTDKEEETLLPTSSDEGGPTMHNIRSEIAKIYIYAFFGVILLTFITGCCKDFTPKEYTDMLITVSGILSGPLGFIIGYYFKAASLKDDNK